MKKSYIVDVCAGFSLDLPEIISYGNFVSPPGSESGEWTVKSWRLTSHPGSYELHDGSILNFLLHTASKVRDHYQERICSGG